MSIKISKKVGVKKCTEKNIFSAHLGAEYFMKKIVENPSKNTDSSMSNFAKSEVKKSGLYDTFSCSRLREILKNEMQKSGLFPLRLRVGDLKKGVL